MYIGGELVHAAAGETFDSLNPYDQTLVVRASRARKADVDLAVEAAYLAFHRGSWRKASGEDRGACLDKMAAGIQDNFSDLVRLEVADSGSTIRKAREDVYLSIQCVKYCAQWARDFRTRKEFGPLSPLGMSRNFLIREPIGVCAAIIPWNFPLKMAVWKIAPALATGNTLVLKPSEETPATALMLGRILKTADLPKGAVNIITGYGHDAGEELIKHPKVGKVSFTGSTQTGKRVMALCAADLKRLTLECGGKSANIILDEEDWNFALDGAVYAMYYHAGQCCEAGSRLFLPKRRVGEMLPALLERIGKIRLGNPFSLKTDMGPLISARQREKVRGFIDGGKAAGAVAILGGKAGETPSQDRGWFVDPTVFTNVDPKSQLAREEIFGPVLSVFAYESDEALVGMANDSEYGLAAGIWTGDAERAGKVADRLRAGTVWVNDYHVIHSGAAFGGYGQSGLGREFGEDGMLEFMETKHLHLGEKVNGDRDARIRTILPA